MPLRKRYFMQASLSFLLRDGFLPLLERSGCVGVQIGVESLTKRYSKNGVRRDASILEETIRKVEVVKRHIQIVQANIILGFDQDALDTFEAVRELHRRSAVDTIVPHVLTPYPGTPLHDEMEQGGRIVDCDDAHYNAQRLVVTLRHFDPDVFYDEYVDLLRYLNAPRRVLAKSARQLLRWRNPLKGAILAAMLSRRSMRVHGSEIPALRRAQRELRDDPRYARTLEAEGTVQRTPVAG